MGAGTSSGYGGGDYSTAANRYQKIADNNANQASAHPNNGTYKNTASLYAALAKAAQGMKNNGKTYSGARAVVYMDNAPVGTRVEISGTPTNDGVYIKENWSQPGYTSGTVWRREGDAYTHSFASNPSTLYHSSGLGMVKGGTFTDDKDRKIRIL